MGGEKGKEEEVLGGLDIYLYLRKSGEGVVGDQ
jgi:hypothetical protein